MIEFVLPILVLQVFLAYKVYGWLFAYSHEQQREAACFCLVPGIGLLIAGAMYLTTGFAKYGWRA